MDYFAFVCLILIFFSPQHREENQLHCEVIIPEQHIRKGEQFEVHMLVRNISSEPIVCATSIAGNHMVWFRIIFKDETGERIQSHTVSTVLHTDDLPQLKIVTLRPQEYFVTPMHLQLKAGEELNDIGLTEGTYSVEAVYTFNPETHPHTAGLYRDMINNEMIWTGSIRSEKKQLTIGNEKRIDEYIAQ